MTKSFQNSFEFLEHLATIYGELQFKFSATSYGKDFDWITDIEEFDSLDKLEEILDKFDEEYHIKHELERGTSRTYILQTTQNGLTGLIKYEWDYAYIGSKWVDKDLVELIRDEIIATLSKAIGMPKAEFSEKYYYNIIFSTEDSLEKDAFLLSEWENDKKMEIAMTTWVSLKEAIIQLSMENGANTSENVCQFDYNLKHEHDYIIEKWSNSIEEFESLKNDNEAYNESKL